MNAIDTYFFFFKKNGLNSPFRAHRLHADDLVAKVMRKSLANIEFQVIEEKSV